MKSCKYSSPYHYLPIYYLSVLFLIHHKFPATHDHLHAEAGAKEHEAVPTGRASGIVSSKTILGVWRFRWLGSDLSLRNCWCWFIGYVGELRRLRLHGDISIHSSLQETSGPPILDGKKMQRAWFLDVSGYAMQWCQLHHMGKPPAARHTVGAAPQLEAGLWPQL